MLVVIALLNYLGYKHHSRLDLTTEKLYTLSDQSRKIASHLTQDVDVMHFSKTADPSVRAVVDEYVNLSPHIHYKDVDPQAHPDIAKQYNVTHLDQIVVASGKQNQMLNGTSEQEITNALVKVTQHRENRLLPGRSWRKVHFGDRRRQLQVHGRRAAQRRLHGLWR